jgi:hypothetical protein
MSGEDIPTFRESLENSLIEVAESPTLKLGLGLIITGPLSEWLAGRGEVVARSRLEDFLQRLVEKINQLEEQKIDKEYFGTPEWTDLFLKALDEAWRTRSEDKREYYARILKGAIVDSERQESSPEEYLYLVSSLTPRELKVARTLYNLQSGVHTLDNDRWKAWQSQKAALESRCSLDSVDLSLILNRLTSVGLLDRIYIQFPGSPVPTYQISPMFKKLMNFLAIKAD